MLTDPSGSTVLGLINRLMAPQCWTHTGVSCTVCELLSLHASEPPLQFWGLGSAMHWHQHHLIGDPRRSKQVGGLGQAAALLLCLLSSRVFRQSG